MDMEVLAFLGLGVALILVYALGLMHGSRF